MKRPLLLAAAAGLLAGVVSAIVLVAAPNWDLTPGREPPSTGTALIGGPFALVDPAGKRVTDKDFAGKPMLVVFGFTNCPDICPAELQLLSAALDKIGPAAGGIAPLFITLDPERDTPAVLGQFLKSFHSGIVGLTGTPGEVAVAAKAYRVYSKKIQDENFPGGYSVDHSAFMYLMDRSGKYVKHFPPSVGVDELAAALAQAV